jgi:hypothetical protein
MHRRSFVLVALLTAVCAARAEARPDPRFVPAIRDAAAHYRDWGRVDEKPNIAPELCRLPSGDDFGVASQVRTSRAGPHKDKLYYLWASGRNAYLSLGHRKAPLPVGFAVVKQSFSSKPVHGEPPVAAKDDPYSFRDVPPIPWLQAADGKRLQIDQPRGLFVMAKVGERDGADRGWIYGTVAPDGTVTSAGRVKQCMGCHESAKHERLFGMLMADGAAADAAAFDEPTPRPIDLAAVALTRGPTGIASCDAYLVAFDAYLACDKVQPQAVDVSREAMGAMELAWAELRDASAAERQSAADSCLEASDAVVKSGRALGCTIAWPPAPSEVAAREGARPKTKVKAKSKAGKAKK